jgi:hypothetical protein
MTDTIYLICSKDKVERMVKTKRSATDVYKGEIPIKLKLTIPQENWRPPFIEKEIIVNRWDENIDIEDVDFDGQFVTEQEAEKIREMRLQKMKDVLENQGYTVTKLDIKEGGETSQ